MITVMFQQNSIVPTTSNIPATFASEDSKYAVADILTSFASGEPATPTSLFSTITSSADIPTPTASDLLTPTTLVNLEQSLMDIQVGVALNLTRESGFVPPVINPQPSTSSVIQVAPMVKEEYADSYMYQDDSSTDSDWIPPNAKQARYDSSAMVIQQYNMTRMPGQMGGRRRKQHDVNMPPEEAERRDVRRERNKVAAAKCRQRRVDLTNTLLVESEGLEEEQSKLENEIQMLQQQKEQLAFLLDAHRPNCSASISHVVKSEPLDSHLGIGPCSSTVSFSTYQPTTKSVIIAKPSISSFISSRPNTLSIPSKSRPIVSVSEAIGVPITTPSGVFSFGLDSMMDGHTGLTPITGTPSCASQLQRNSTDGSSSPDNLASPTTLMAL